jgi:hypothetical protein
MSIGSTANKGAEYMKYRAKYTRIVEIDADGNTSETALNALRAQMMEDIADPGRGSGFTVRLVDECRSPRKRR